MSTPTTPAAGSAALPSAGSTPSEDAAAPRFAMDGRLLAVVVIGMLATFAWGFALAGDMLPGTEVRFFFLRPFTPDPSTLLLFPQLSYGDTRWTAMGVFRLAGQVCGRDISCLNGFSVGLTSLAVGLLILHTARLLRSPWLAGLVALLWVASGPVLNIWIWPSTWSDLVAFIMLMVVAPFWWWALARPRIGPAGGVAFVVLSLVLLVLAFSAKELLWVLIGILPILALVRSPEGAVRRNVVLIAVPMAWMAWYIAWALINVDPAYARIVGSNPIPTGIAEITEQALSIAPEFMSLRAPGPGAGTLHGSAIDLYLLFGVLALGAIAWGARHWRRPDTSAGRGPTLLAIGRRLDVEVYLAALLGSTVLVASRSEHINAYYTLIPLWAGITLSIAVLRRVRATWVALILAAGLLVAYVGLLRPGAVAPSLLQASATLRDTGAAIHTLLEGREVKHITWQTEGPPFGEFYLIRDNSKPSPWQAGPDLIFFIAGLRPWVQVTDLPEGTAESIARDVVPVAPQGEAVIVIDDQYRLALLGLDGEVLYLRPSPPPNATPAPTPAPSVSPSVSPSPAMPASPGPASTPAPSSAPSSAPSAAPSSGP